ncbi:hypothetical protein C8F04DRAFT_1158918 [Mycena alexandri]|uniref:AMP deaminase n=1 Tax=Mycena alexandri TaxID=1745969 RepID=A0AAD6WLI5_9AGAR|nr:hypothetical protein C8F04DRAFT_1158918 [Mycena alexandri]
MSNADGRDAIASPTETHVNTPELDIPEARDEEKTQQHIEEKYWAHRRGSETASEGTAASFVNSFKLSGIHSAAPPGEYPSGGDPFVEEDDEKHMKEEVHVPETVITSELAQLFQSFQRCLELRDKYILKSRQRLGDDPRHYDGYFLGLDDNNAGVCGVRTDGNYASNRPPASARGLGIFTPNRLRPTGTGLTRLSLAPMVPIPTMGISFEWKTARFRGLIHSPSKLTTRGSFKFYDVEVNNSSDEEKTPVYDIPNIREYFVDLDYVLGVISDGPTKSFAFRRLKYLASKFTMYSLLNEFQELSDMKVDTHVHHSSSMNQKHLLRFIKSKMKRSPDAALTLTQVFQSLKLTAYDLSIDTLDMHAHSDSFHRFDKFNLKYNPIGDKYQNCEWRVSIYGRSKDEWDKLAKWIVNNKLYSHNVRWLIQVPRLYDIYKANGSVKTFQDIISNVFVPLFEVTKDPRTHPELHVFLQRVVGFDTVDDESKTERRIYKKFPYPRLWDTKESPPYSYWVYYMFANMASLNNWRQERGFNTFIRTILTSAFLTSHSISHGILLPTTRLFLAYERNPLPDFFKTGLNVSLSTDDPLQFHFTKAGREPLLEEYSVAAHIYKFPQSSLAELARNSVIQSGFEMDVKRHWLGHRWYLPGAAGNDIHKTNVPNIRLAYRHQTLMEELTMISTKTAIGHSPERRTAVLPTVEAVAARAMAPTKHSVC